MVSTIGIESKNLFCPEGAEHTPSLQDESFFHICPVVGTILLSILAGHTRY